MKPKPILCPHRLRRVPPQFSWIDQRLVRDRHLQGRTPAALALYLFLCTVADAQGLSYYADTTAAQLLGFSTQTLRAARAELTSAGLIAYRRPFYQVLSLDPPSPPPPQPAHPLPSTPPRTREPQSIGEILRSFLEGPP